MQDLLSELDGVGDVVRDVGMGSQLSALHLQQDPAGAISQNHEILSLLGLAAARQAVFLVLHIASNRLVALPPVVLLRFSRRPNRVVGVALLHDPQALLQLLTSAHAYVYHQVLFTELEVALVEYLLPFEFPLLAAAAELEVLEVEPGDFPPELLRLHFGEFQVFPELQLTLNYPRLTFTIFR